MVLIQRFRLIESGCSFEHVFANKDSLEERDAKRLVAGTWLVSLHTGLYSPSPHLHLLVCLSLDSKLLRAGSY